jgi:hypothetical protein
MKIFFVSTQTVPKVPGEIAMRDMISGAFVGQPIDYDFTTTVGGTEIEGVVSAALVPIAYYSERIAAPLTLSGNLVWRVNSSAESGTPNATFRMRLWKITRGGHVKTLLGTFDGLEAIAGATDTLRTWTYTNPFPPLSLGIDERLVARFWAIPAPGLTMAAGVISWNTAGALEHSIEIDNITFVPNTTRFYLRRTSDIGIAGFMDMLPTKNPSGAYTTGLIYTTAGGTELQWTRAVPPLVILAGDGVGAVNDTANAASYVSSSFTPTVNRLYLLAVVHSDAAPETTIPTITTTTGLNFVEVATVPFDTIASNVHRITLFRAMKASGLSTGTFTVNLADAGTGCLARLWYADNVITTGTDGADAIRGVVTNSANAGANPSITMGAFEHEDNGVFACFGLDIATAPTAGTNYGSLGATTYATPTTGLFGEFSNMNNTVANCTVASSDWGGIAVEVRAYFPAPPEPNLLEWISPRFAESWYFQDQGTADAMLIRTYPGESSTSANAAIRVRVFRWRNGVETECFSASYNQELPTVPAVRDIYPNNTFVIDEAFAPMEFLEDDRLVLRPYVINFGTMAAGFTATLRYDDSGTATGNCYLDIIETARLKAEGDPGHKGIPDSQSTLGIQN